MKSFEKIIKEGTPTLLVFQHSGMNDAVKVKYLFEEIRDKYAGKVNVHRVDASHNGQYKVDYKLREYPTWILYKGGEELMRESGDKTAAELDDMIARAL